MKEKGMKPSRYGLVLMAALALFVFLGFSRFLGAGRDDTFITLWVGENLAQGQGFVNHNFERVEISSSLLHTLLVTLLVLVAPAQVYFLNKMAGLAAGCLVLWLICRYRRTLFPRAEYRFFACSLTLATLATMPSFIYWSLGGLETPFVTLLLFLMGLGFLHFWNQPTRGNEAGLLVCQCAFLMLRPESFYVILFTGVFVLFVLGFKGRRSSLLRLVLIPLVFFLLLGAARRFYFGTFFPNPVYAKTNGLFHGLSQGLTYVGEFYTSSTLLLGLGLFNLVLILYYAVLLARSLKNRERLVRHAYGGLIFLLGFSITVHLVVILAGGDWMEFYRFMQPVTPWLAVLPAAFLARFLGALDPRLQARGAQSLMKGIAVFLAFVGITAAAWSNSGQNSLVNSCQGPLQLHIDFLPIEYTLKEVFWGEKDLDESVKMLNFAYGRDKTILFPFLERALPSLGRRYGRLVIATPQMGLFPYHLRKNFPDLDIVFIDTYGLCNPEVALMDMPSGSCGNALGRQMSMILAGEAGPLSDHVLAKKPNLIYLLYAKDEELAKIEAKGYRCILKLPGANLLFNPDIR